MSEARVPQSKVVTDELLTLACLFCGSFSVDWILELSGQKASAVLVALDQGVQCGLLERTSLDTFCVIDSDQRQAALAGLPADARNSWRRQIVELLSYAGGDDPALRETALQLAQLPADVETLGRLLEVGRALNRRYRRTEAQASFQAIIDSISPETDPDDPVVGVFVDAVHAFCRYVTGNEEIDWMLEAVGRAIAYADLAGTLQVADLLRLNQAMFFWWQGAHQQSVDLFEHTWARVEARDDDSVMRTAVHLRMFFLWQQGRFGEVVAVYEQHRPLLARYPRSQSPILVTSMLGNCYVWLGQVSMGMGLMNGQYEQCQRLGQSLGALQVACGLGMSFIDLGQPERAIDIIRDTLATHREFATPQVLAGCHGNMALAYAALKDPSRSLEEWNHQAAHLATSQAPWPKLLVALLDAYPSDDLPESLLDSVRRVVERIDTIEVVRERGLVLVLEAIVLSQHENKPESAAARLEAAVDQLEQSGDLIERAKTQFRLSRVRLSLGQAVAASEAASEAASFLEPISPALVPKDLMAQLDADFGHLDLSREIEALNREIVGIRDYRQLVQRLLARINQLTGAERGALFDVVDGEAVLTAAVVLTKDDVESDEFGQARVMIQRAAASGQPEIYERDELAGLDEQDQQHASMRSGFCLPMYLGDRVVGVLYHDNCLLQGRISEADFPALLPLVGLAAIAIDNARAYEEIQRLNKQLNRERDYYQKELEADQHTSSFIGNSTAIRKVFGRITQVASSNATVLVLGETGVGKEHVARAIHEASDRRQAPFVRVDCNSLSESLISSEMFGHEKGAFTGALQRRIGRFELADGGTLFLDEIGNLSAEIQAALLRVLETREFQRVGGNADIRSDFRLITATNEDLAVRVREGTFRQDLFYRLNVYPIQVPPLRDRRDDIPLLAHYYLAQFSAEAGKKVDRIDAASLERLQAYDWPGNVRELKNLIERAVLLSTDTYLLLPEFGAEPASETLRDDMTLAELERQHILQTLGRTGGKIDGRGGAAERLGLHHNTLRSRMKKLGIVRNAGSAYVHKEA